MNEQERRSIFGAELAIVRLHLAEDARPHDDVRAACAIEVVPETRPLRQILEPPARERLHGRCC